MKIGDLVTWIPRLSSPDSSDSIGLITGEALDYQGHDAFVVCWQSNGRVMLVQPDHVELMQ